MRKNSLFVVILLALLLATAPESYALDNVTVVRPSTNNEETNNTVATATEEVTEEAKESDENIFANVSNETTTDTGNSDEKLTVANTNDEPVEEKTEEKATEEKKPETYTVVSGDWLLKICAKYNCTLDELLAVNPWITNPNLIHPGEVITIPTKEEVKEEEKEENKEEEKIKDSDAKKGGKGTDTDNVETVRYSDELAKATLDNAIQRYIANGGSIEGKTTQEIIDALHDGKFLRDEDWMSMNPPEGKIWSIDEKGNSSFVEANKENKTETETESPTLWQKIKAKIQALIDKLKGNKKEEEKKDDEKKDKKDEVKKDEKKDDRTAAEKNTNSNLSIEQKAENDYQEALGNMPDIRNVSSSDYNKAMTSLLKLYGWNTVVVNLPALERNCYNKYQTFEKKFAEHDNSGLSTYNTAKKSADSAAENMQNAWKVLSNQIDSAYKKAKEADSLLKTSKKELENLESNKNKKIDELKKSYKKQIAALEKKLQEAELNYRSGKISKKEYEAAYRARYGTNGLFGTGILKAEKSMEEKLQDEIDKLEKDCKNQKSKLEKNIKKSQETVDQWNNIARVFDKNKVL